MARLQLHMFKGSYEALRTRTLDKGNLYSKHRLELSH
jgi:hypothetical protein